MGEIGIPRLEYLYDLQYWEIMLIVRGYNRRHRDLWSSTRWSTFYIMSTQADLGKAGIFNPTDLIKFPWEQIKENLPPDEIVQKLRAEIQEENKQKEKESQQ